MEYSLCFVFIQLFIIFMLQYRRINTMFLLFNEKTSFSHISLIKNRINHKRVGLSL